MTDRDLPMMVTYKKVKREISSIETAITTWYKINCPNCEGKMVHLFSPSMFQLHYCFHCGQRLDWSYIKNIVEHDFEE